MLSDLEKEKKKAVVNRLKGTVPTLRNEQYSDENNINIVLNNSHALYSNSVYIDRMFSEIKTDIRNNFGSNEENIVEFENDLAIVLKKIDQM